MGMNTTGGKNVNPLRLGVAIGLAVVSVGVVGVTLGSLIWQHRPRLLKLAAGSRSGESYILSQALAQVVKRHYPRVQIEVVETGGTAESLTLLQSRQVSFAAAQADVPAGDRARMVAVLFPDSLQLVVPRQSSIDTFSDLKGKRIALPPKGGQYRSFLEVASHFGLSEADFIFLGKDQESANDAYRTNRADAAFFVRALGHPPIRDFIQNKNSRLVPIEQAKALQIKYGAFEPSVIPQGAYRGSPAIPATDLPTIAVQRVLLVDHTTDRHIVQIITEVLNDRRQELARAIPDDHSEVRTLVTSIDRPGRTGGTGIALHAGALAYYERDQPSFIQANADYVALILTIVLLVGSWIVEAKNWINRQKKDAADIYIEVAVELMQDEITAAPEENRHELDKIFMKAARDLVEERISQESFRTFNEAYKTAREVLERKMYALRDQQALQEQLIAKEADALRKEHADHHMVEILALAKTPTPLQKQAFAQLDRILQAAGQDLIDEKISQESFRTLIEAYKTVRETIVWIHS